MSRLFLIPTLLADTPVDHVIPLYDQKIIKALNYFIVENERTARRFLKKVDKKIVIDELTFFVLNKHTPPSEIHQFLQPLTEGNDMGLMSEAGAPAVADPGSVIVQTAHEKGIEVVPLVGPSSILLALMASGMNGQNFVFHGYLPVKKQQKTAKLRQIEKRSETDGQTQIFIETPYRNRQMIEDILSTCQSSTKLCIACDITAETQFIQTKSVSAWRGRIPDIQKRAAIFLLQKNS